MWCDVLSLIWHVWFNHIGFLIDYLLFYVPLKNIFHIYGDVTIDSKGLQNLYLALMAFEQEWIFIVPHLR
jgi:hypothetical protein